MNGSILKIKDTEKVFCGKINKLQNNDAWREAIWQTFYKVYIKYSVQQARQRGFNSALTIGSFVDTALNQALPAVPERLKAFCHAQAKVATRRHL